MLYLIKELLLPPGNLSILYRIFFFFFWLHFSLLPLLLTFVLQASVLEVCMQACKWRPQLFMCVACVLLSSSICKKLPLQRFGLMFHMHISKQTVSDKQPLYLPRRAMWATFAPMTASICSGSEFNMCCTIL